MFHLLAIALNACPTSLITTFNLKFIAGLPSFDKDSNDFLNKLLAIDNLPANYLLVLLDVSAFYTNIPHNKDINVCENFLLTSSHNTIPKGTLCDTTRVILAMNNFFFNDNTREFKHDVYGRRQTAKVNSDFLFFSCNP